MKLTLSSDKTMFLDKLIKTTKSEYIIFEISSGLTIYLYSNDLSQMSIIKFETEFFDEFSVSENEMLQKNIFAIPSKKFYEPNMNLLQIRIENTNKILNHKTSELFDTQNFYYDKDPDNSNISNTNELENSINDQKDFNSMPLNYNKNLYGSLQLANSMISTTANESMINFIDLKYNFSSMNLVKKIPTTFKEIYDIEFTAEHIFNLDLAGLKKFIFELKEKEVSFSLGASTKISSKTFDLALPGSGYEKKFTLDTDLLKNMVTVAGLFDEYQINISDETINFVFTLSDCTFNVFSSI